MRAAGRLLGAALAVCAVAAARGQDEAQGIVLEAVEAGFGGAAAWRVPAPVWVTLVNRRGEDAEVQVVARSRLATAERRVPLPAGAHKRVQLALVLEGELRVELREDGRPSAEQTVDYDALSPDRHLLVLDGRPPATWTGAATDHADQLLRHTTIEAASAPVEAACYMGVAAVLLREADPSGWSPDQREALLEWVREGGLLLVAGVTPKAPALARFFDGLPASAVETRKLVGRAARTRRAGLGAVAAFADDPLHAAATHADLKQRLGELLAATAAARRYPRPADPRDTAPLAGPGARTQLLVGGFVVAYFLAVGPVLALVLRRARRARLAGVTALLVLGFTLLAPVVAGLVRTGRGEARHRSVLWVPPEGGGPALELGEVLVTSGGGTGYRIDLERRDGGALTATLIEGWTPAGHQPGPTGWSWVEERPAVVRSSRGPRVSVDASMPPWGDQRLITQALRVDARPVRATLVFEGATGGVLTVENTSGVTLSRAILVPDDENTRNGNPLYVPVGDLAPGATRQVEVPRALAMRRRTFDEALDVPWAWRSWGRLDTAGLPPDAGARPPRYRLISRARPAVEVTGRHLEGVVHALRIDEVAVTPPPPRGFIGVRLVDADGAVVIAPMKGGPAERAGLRDGDVVVAVDGAAVRSSDELRLKVAARAPGDLITVAVRGADGALREHRVKVARTPGE